mgnify:CR=1 FL=1
MLNTRYGAESSEWNSVFCNDDLRPWVLPIVSNVNIPLSPNSSIKEVGKTPTIKNRKGFVAGVKEWTALPEATDAQIMTWAKDPDNGYCVRTGHNGLIGIDCDVNDPELSKKVKELFLSHCHIKEENFIYRTRGGARWATFIKLDTGASRAKQVVSLDGAEIDGKKPAVEFLGLGQQLACAGTHPSGKKYSWPRGLGVLEVTESDYNNFLAALVLLYGAEDIITAKSSAPRVKGESYAAEDRLRDWLLDKGLVLKEGRAGELYIRCPWEELHTSDTGDTQTVYFPIGSNGYDAGGFHCFHAHCSDKTIADFKAWAKSQGYQETSAEDFPDESTNNVIELVPENAGEVEDIRRAKGKLSAWFLESMNAYRSTPDSVTTAMRLAVVTGYYIAYDTFTQSVKVKEYHSSEWRNIREEDNLKIRIALERFGFIGKGLSKDLIKDGLQLVAQENTFDFMQDWLDANIPAWDGVERVKNFFHEYCGADNTEYTRACGTYLFTALWGRAYNNTPTKADIAIVLVGEQGARKSSLVEALALSSDWYTAIDFNAKDDDNIRNIQGKITAELPELSGMNRKDVTSIKSFLSKSSDTWVKKYQEQSTTASRRCVFIMTTNEKHFLSDKTGNRRYAPIETGSIRLKDVEDNLLQLWAEGRELYKRFGVAQRQVEAYNTDALAAHAIEDPWEEKILEYLESRENDPDAPLLTTKNILSYALGVDVKYQKRGEVLHVAEIMRKLGYPKTQQVKGENLRERVWIKS